MQEADIVIIGGSLSGCFAAVQAAEAGKRVVLAEKREYLGMEIAAYNHTFVGVKGEERFNRVCPPWVERLFSMRSEREALAPEGLTRQYLIEEMAERGVTVLYSALAVGLTKDEAGVSGVLLATPLGVFHLAARCVIDATERWNLGRIVAGRSYVQGEVVVQATFEMEGVAEGESEAPCRESLAQVERHSGLVADSLQLHPTLRKHAQVVAFSYRATVGDPYKARSALEHERIAKSGTIAAGLRQALPGFAKARLSHMAYEARLLGDDFVFPNIAGLQPLAALPWGFSLDDVATVWEQAAMIIAAPRLESESAASIFTEAVESRVCGEEKLHLRGSVLPFSRHALAPYEDAGLPIRLLRVDPAALAAELTSFPTDICVAGSGAGGGMAMLAAGEQGLRVTVIEVNTLMGGTHTVGRVANYYDGYRGGMNQRVEESAKAFAQTMGEQPDKGGVPHAAYLNHRAAELGVQLFAASLACGVLRSGRKIQGIVAANEDGLFCIPATVTVDASGNADVAALAGAAYEIGDPETGMVQSYSMWGEELYPLETFLAHRYLRDPGICHPDLYSERLRAVRDGHFQNSPYRISPMVTVRESRRIVGEQALTVRDLLDERRWDDAIAVACTRADSHAYTSSPLAHMGGLSGNEPLQVRIPYGCFIPKGVEGLLVAAKALSGERDATSFCRMNADIKNAGYAIGLAAACAVQQDKEVRQIDLPALQARLRELDILPKWAFVAPQLPDVVELVDRSAAGEEEAYLALLRRPAEQALPSLLTRYAAGGRSYIVHALAWFGADIGGTELAEQLQMALREGRHHTLPLLHPPRAGMHVGRTPLDDYTLIERLAVLAGRSGHPDTLAPLAELIADTSGYGKPLPSIMPYDTLRGDMVRLPFYRRILTLAYAAAQRQSIQLAPALEKLLDRPGIMGYVTQGLVHKPGNYMLAHAEIRLARAAIRCGSKRGEEVLVTYLNDTHVAFRETARKELARHAAAKS